MYEMVVFDELMRKTSKFLHFRITCEESISWHVDVLFSVYPTGIQAWTLIMQYIGICNVPSSYYTYILLIRTFSVTTEDLHNLGVFVFSYIYIIYFTISHNNTQNFDV